MNNAIRNAKLTDTPQMVELSEQKRLQYQQYQPTFWRKAKNSKEVQLSYFEDLINKENNIILVYQMERQIIGFVIATLHSAPPVYNPGGLICTIDDFCVAESKDWSEVGNSLLTAITTRAKKKGAVQIIVVCGHLDQPKRKMLSQDSFTIASEWYVRNI